MGPAIAIVLFLVVLGHFHCAPGDRSGNGGSHTVRPVLDAIFPASAVSHRPSFTLTAQGHHFQNGAVIVFNGVAKETAFVSSTELTCVIEPADTSVGTAGGTLMVTVRAAGNGSNESNGLEFTVFGRVGFTDPVRIPSAAGSSRYPVLAVDGNADGGVNVVWEVLSGSYINFIRSANNGGSWEGERNISGSGGDFRRPAIVLGAAGNLYAAFYNGRDNYRDLYFVRSADGGDSWTVPFNVSANPGGNYDPDLVLDVGDGAGGAINLVWTDDTPGRRCIFFSRCNGGGVDEGCWSAPVNLSASLPGVSMEPAIAADSAGNLYVAWLYWDHEAIEVYLCRSTDYGATWGEPRNVSNLSDWAWTPRIAVGRGEHAGDMYVLWVGSQGNGVSKIYFCATVDGGDSWERKKVLSTGYGPSFAVDRAGNICLSWCNDDVTERVLFSRSVDGGVRWSDVVPVGSRVQPHEPRLAVDGAGMVHLVWGNYNPVSDALEIFYSRSVDGG